MSWTQFFTLLDTEPSLTEPLARAFTLFPHNTPSRSYTDDKDTPILLAAHCRNEKILSLFLSAVPFYFPESRLAIQAAVANDNAPYLKLILSQLGGDPGSGFALHCAATFNRPKIARWLVTTFHLALVRPLAIETKHGSKPLPKAQGA